VHRQTPQQVGPWCVEEAGTGELQASQRLGIERLLYDLGYRRRPAAFQDRAIDAVEGGQHGPHRVAKAARSHQQLAQRHVHHSEAAADRLIDEVGGTVDTSAGRRIDQVADRDRERISRPREQRLIQTTLLFGAPARRQRGEPADLADPGERQVRIAALDLRPPAVQR
jgi:hypothetical protein